MAYCDYYFYMKKKSLNFPIAAFEDINYMQITLIKFRIIAFIKSCDNRSMGVS